MNGGSPDPAPSPPARGPVIRTIAMPGDANPSEDIFGGWLMADMDLAAGNVATRHARSRVATVAVEAMSVLSPVLVGYEVSFYGEVLSLDAHPRGSSAPPARG